MGYAYGIHKTYGPGGHVEHFSLNFVLKVINSQTAHYYKDDVVYLTDDVVYLTDDVFNYVNKLQTTNYTAKKIGLKSYGLYIE